MNAAVRIALAGAVSLAVAMGIGRFAFTPLLPMMLHDGVVDLRGAGWLASANYLGYLAGALACTFWPWLRARWRRRAPGSAAPPLDEPRLVRAGLVATCVLTLAMTVPWAAAWPLWRFAAGVASAVVFVYTSGWCLAQLARHDAPALGGVMYTGPGAGIVVSGLFASAMVAWGWRAVAGWAIFGLLGFALTAVVWRVFGPGRGATAASRVGPGAGAGAGMEAEASPPLPVGELACLAVGYGGAGFGYIVTATFLPVIARAALPESPWLDLFWPVFGFGVVVGALLATRLRRGGDMRLLLATCYAVQAGGVGLTVLWPTLAGFALGSLLLGLPFTAITFFAMQEVRRLAPARIASTMGLLTAFYGVGQIVGPPLATWLLGHGGATGGGFDRALEVAAGVLLAGALLFLGMWRGFPLRPAEEGLIRQRA